MTAHTEVILPRFRIDTPGGDVVRNQATGFPNGFIPFSSTVFGKWSVPHKMKEPKSLYQSPGEATGPVFDPFLER
jgi:hypothetical protein